MVADMHRYTSAVAEKLSLWNIIYGGDYITTSIIRCTLGQNGQTVPTKFPTVSSEDFWYRCHRLNDPFIILGTRRKISFLYFQVVFFNLSLAGVSQAGPRCRACPAIPPPDPLLSPPAGKGGSGHSPGGCSTPPANVLHPQATAPTASHPRGYCRLRQPALQGT